jgi:hypothetical protein
MEKLKEIITENGIDYILVGDYYIPDLKLSDESRPIERYGRLHRDYLKQEHPIRYSSLILTGELWTYPVALNILKSYCSIIETSHTREQKISGKFKILLV